MAKTLTQYLLISLVLTLGFGQLLRLDLGPAPLYLHDILVCLLILLNFRPRLLAPRALGLRLFLAGLSLGWLLALPTFPLASLLTPSLYTLRLLTYLYLASLLRALNPILKPHFFALSLTLTLLLGYWQYFRMPDMRWAQYLGWDDHLSRLTLPHYDPTFSAVMLGIGLLSFVPKAHFLLPTLAITPAILLTYARSVWLALLSTLLLYLRPRRLALLLTGLFLLLVTLLPVRFGEGTNLLRTFSITSRFQSDLAYLTHNPWQLLLGRGLNTLPLTLPESLYPNHATGPNNSYLYLLATTGVLGLVGWGMMLRSVYRRSAHKPMFIFIALASLFNNVMFYPFVLLWVILLESSE